MLHSPCGIRASELYISSVFRWRSSARPCRASVSMASSKARAAAAAQQPARKLIIKPLASALQPAGLCSRALACAAEHWLLRVLCTAIDFCQLAGTTDTCLPCAQRSRSCPQTLRPSPGRSCLRQCMRCTRSAQSRPPLRSCTGCVKCSASACSVPACSSTLATDFTRFCQCRRWRTCACTSCQSVCTPTSDR